MARAQRPRHFARHGVAHDRVLQQRQLAIEHGDVNLGRLARALAMEERGVHRHRRIEPSADVADRHARAHRRLARMAGDAHDAAQALHDHVVSGFLRGWPGVAEARGRRIDELRIARVQCFPAVAQLLHGARTEVLDEYVRALEQTLENAPVGLGLQVERDRFLAAVDRGEIRGDPVLERAILPGVVALARRLDFDHPCPQLRHQECAIGPREDAREIDDGDAGKRAGRGHGVTSRWALRESRRHS